MDVTDSPRTSDDFEDMLAGFDRILNDKALQQQLLDAGLLVRTEPGEARPTPVEPEARPLREVLARLLDHHENTCRVTGGPGAECVVRDEARDALRRLVAESGTIERGGWWHPAECSNAHNEGGNCLDNDGCIVGWRDPVEYSRITGTPSEANARRLAVEPDGLPLDVRQAAERVIETYRAAIPFSYISEETELRDAVAALDVSVRAAVAYARLGPSEDKP